MAENETNGGFGGGFGGQGSSGGPAHHRGSDEVFEEASVASVFEQVVAKVAPATAEAEEAAEVAESAADGADSTAEGAEKVIDKIKESVVDAAVYSVAEIAKDAASEEPTEA